MAQKKIWLLYETTTSFDKQYRLVTNVRAFSRRDLVEGLIELNLKDNEECHFYHEQKEPLKVKVIEPEDKYSPFISLRKEIWLGEPRDEVFFGFEIHEKVINEMTAPK